MPSSRRFWGKVTGQENLFSRLIKSQNQIYRDEGDSGNKIKIIKFFQVRLLQKS
jgi:hypothetical protein